MIQTSGIHHITAITADPQKNLDFYEGFLGQRFIKRTVNFDDSDAYHLYYGDEVGTPGTIMTFFYWAGLSVGKPGAGEVNCVAYRIKPESLEYWETRSVEHGLEYKKEENSFGETMLVLQDPDGLRIELVVAQGNETIQSWKSDLVESDHVLQGFYSATLCVHNNAAISSVLTDALGYEQVDKVGNEIRYKSTNQPGQYVVVQEDAQLPQARQGAGSVHHIAFQAADDDERMDLESQAQALGLVTTGLVDRQYFHATYFMTPAAILFEIATNDIGFTIDESVEELGTNLQLPPHFRDLRYTIEPHLEPIELPRDRHD